MASGAHHTATMRRPTATRWARRRAASTSGSSGTPAALLHDLEQLHLEHEGRARLDARGRAALPVGEGRGAHDAALAPDLHALHRFRPAWDDLVQREGGGLLALHRAVEDGAVGERAVVVHLHLVGG